MKNLALTAIFLCAGSTLTFSQSYFYNSQYYDNDLICEAGLSLGIMNCFTDLGGRSGAGKPFLKDLNWKQVQFCGGLYAGILYRYCIGLRLEATVGSVAADDNSLKGDQSTAQYRYRRNLHFRSPVTELSLLAEFHPFAWLANAREQEPPLFSPFLAAGIGLFKFSPEAQLDGNWVSLQPLHTEGQGFIEFPDRKPYKLTQLNFPVGIGIRYEVSAVVIARIECIHRILLTDYLDDVSRQYIDPALFYQHLEPGRAALAAQLADRRRYSTSPNNAPLPYKEGAIRGNPQNRDGYFSINCKLSFVLNRRRQ